MTKKGILLVSFGTSYQETREKTIDALQRHVEAAFPEYAVFMAFTSAMVRNILKKRGMDVPDVKAALDAMQKAGIAEVVVQPTHLLHGIEYERMRKDLHSYWTAFDHLQVGRPLLSSTEDMKRVLHTVVEAVSEQIPSFKASETLSETALVLMGHGTHHFSNAVYPALNYIAGDMGYRHVYIGTVEGYPEVETMIESVKANGYRKVLLTPLMFVAGDHAQNDMASDEADSWKTLFEAAGFEVTCLVRGLGEYACIQGQYGDHIRDAIGRKGRV